MERDFMGLAKVKDEISEEPIDAAPVRSIPMQWSFSNKNPNIPHHQIMPFHEKPKTGFDSLASSGLVSITTSEAFDASRKPYANVVQGFQKTINIVPEKKHGGFPYTIHQPVTSHANMSSSTTMHHFGQNLIGSMNVRPLAGNSISNPAAVVSHSNNHVVGTTALRNSPKLSSAPAQLTIFYNGSVCVYDNISPEKAQAIMLLAGNGPSTPSSSPSNPVMNQVQTSSSMMAKPSVIEGFTLNQPQVTTTISNWPSPSPVNSISIAKLPGSNNDIANPKLGSIFIPSQKPEPLKVVANPPRSSSVALFSSDTVPQFRKKSLARFLEKRKERVISSAPYNATKQSAN